MKNKSYQNASTNQETYVSTNDIHIDDEDTNNYKIGIWVKDSSAGVGTLTFYSPSSNVLVCVLGSVEELPSIYLS